MPGRVEGESVGGCRFTILGGGERMSKQKEPTKMTLKELEEEIVVLEKELDTTPSSLLLAKIDLLKAKMVAYGVE